MIGLRNKKAVGRPTWTGSSGARPPSVGRVLVYVALIALTLLFLAPVIWAVLSSFKSRNELAERPPSLLPDSLGLDNYTEALSRFDFTTYVSNSAIVTVSATVLTLAINAMAAYALAKYNFRGRNLLFLITLGTIMIPLQIILIPLQQVASDLGMTNSLLGMIIPPAATPTGVFLLRQYMLTIPDELIESARIDGAGEFRIFLRIILPLCKAPLAVVTIFSVIWRWNDFLWPLVIAQSQDLYTLPVALAQFNSEEVVPFNYILAMSVVSMVPVILIFLVMQRHIVRGIAQTGLK
ncbi:carbohydrate ABC transporter membrane protein 2 (CUT1 family) [Herbihabitans rhizosphaerae]|uniref:Carbohydrate ABC transporter membrane protein 2 (CUT1 family) n=1 Tax=Herbihabitans rhizosphaerae TaxID=1872711 RepID=A0A4Q7KBZ0_9PSEU|nr:carbohydrate ABC transporter permease [Herbihabitans rhizosphaerae]RZS30314.1 carbohydrate ABC transporter membrane protein 2 (CUT1 family) [Herbihabitans rhizosphaerae]